MRKLAALFLLSFAGCTPLLAQESAHTSVLVIHGLLSRASDSGLRWILTADDPLKFQGENLLKVTFATRTADESRAFEPFEHQRVELVGDVKSVSHGSAELSGVHSIAVLASPIEALRGDTTISAAAPPALSATTPRVPYKHAYYLFLSGTSSGC